MRKFLLLVIAFLAGLNYILFSQNDSLRGLETALQNAKTEVEKAATLNRLAEFQRKSGNLAAAAEAAGEAFEISKSENLESELAEAHDQLGLIFEAKFDFGNAMKSYVSGLKIRENGGDAAGTALSKYHVGRLFFLQNDLENSQNNLESALQSEDPETLAAANQTLGELWQTKKIFGKAQQHFRMALDQKIEAEDLPGAAEIANLLGKFAFELGDNEGALVYFRQSFDLNSSTENLAGMANDNLNLGRAHLQINTTEEALTAFQTAERLFREAKDAVGTAKSLVAQADLLRRGGKSADAEKLLVAATDLLSKIQAVPGVPEIFKNIADGHREAGNLNLAYQNLVKFTEAEKAVFGFEKNKAMLELTTRYQSEFAAEEQQRVIEKLEIQQAGSQKVRWALLGILAFAALALWAMFRSNRQKKQDNKTLHSKNVEIDSKNRQLGEKNQHLDELNNRLVGEIANREMLEQTAFDRDKFITLLSREMRSPIQDILSKTRTLLAEKPKNGKGEALRNIQFGASNLLVMLNDLLEHSKIEAGKIMLESEEFEVRKIVEEVKHQFLPAFNDTATGFGVKISEDVPVKLLGDPLRFNQILSNLLTNLSRHGDFTDVRLDLDVAESDVDTLVLKMELNAVGHGLENEEIEALAQPVSTIFDQNSEERGANVISLALAKRLVHLQNGYFEAENMGDVGSIFTLNLPFKKAGRVQTSVPDFLAKNPFPLTGKYILVAEDNKINQLVVVKMLEKAGAVVVPTDDGVAALEAFRAGNFDLVLMDIQMPRLDGYRTVAEMRKDADEAKRSVPIIALTASAYLTDKDKAELFQMNDHIGKPFSPEELMEKVVGVFVK